MTTATRGPSKNVVLVLRGSDILATFSSESATEGAKNPAQQAKLWLKGILDNKESEYYRDLVNGGLTTLSGHPQKIEPKMEMSI